MVAAEYPGVVGGFRDRAILRLTPPPAGATCSSTTKIARLSISAWAPKNSRASLPLPLLTSLASGSVVDLWVSLLRRSP